MVRKFSRHMVVLQLGQHLFYSFIRLLVEGFRHSKPNIAQNLSRLVVESFVLSENSDI